ncbi:FCD domain-containing protein [Cryobacterium serini]|nr:FCD domain-containing protein [Cryobacterium serini]
MWKGVAFSHSAPRLAGFESLPSELKLTLDEHEQVFAAIDAANPDAAEAAMRSHILDTWERRRPQNHRHRS